MLLCSYTYATLWILLKVRAAKGKGKLFPAASCFLSFFSPLCRDENTDFNYILVLAPRKHKAQGVILAVLLRTPLSLSLSLKSHYCSSTDFSYAISYLLHSRMSACVLLSSLAPSSLREIFGFKIVFFNFDERRRMIDKGLSSLICCLRRGETHSYLEENYTVFLRGEKEYKEEKSKESVPNFVSCVVDRSQSISFPHSARLARRKKEKGKSSK